MRARLQSGPPFTGWAACTLARIVLRSRCNLYSYTMKADASAALYLRARAYTEAHPVKTYAAPGAVNPNRWGAIANHYDEKRRTYTLRVHLNGAPLHGYALHALNNLSINLQMEALDMGLDLQPGGGELEPIPGGVCLVFA